MLNKKFKKAISAVTMFATVISLSGVSMLGALTANAATIVDGDLIKSNATNSDGTPTLASTDVYIVKIVGTKKFKRLILNPEVFNSYGHLKWSNIKTVSQAEEDSYAISSLVRVDGDTKVYALTPAGDTGAKSWVNVTADQFISGANSDPDSIYTINSVDSGFYAVKTDITTVDQLKAFYRDGSLPAGTVTDGALQVTLASTTPESANVPTSVGVELLKFNLAASNAGDVVVNGITLTAGGLGAANQIQNVALYDSNGNRINTTLKNVSSEKTVTLNTNGFVVKAGTTETITVKASFATAVSNMYLGIKAAGDVASNAASTGGSFPVNGNAITSVVASGLATLVISDDGTPSTVNLGDKGAVLAKFKINNNGNNEDSTVTKISLKRDSSVSSSAADDDFENLALYSGSTKIATASGIVNKYVTFNIDGGVSVPKNQTKKFTVKGDVVDGAGKNIKLSLDDGVDVTAAGASYPSIITDSYTGSTVAISAGAFTIEKVNAPVDKIKPNTTNVVLGTFKMTANSGQEVDLSSLALSITTTNDNQAAASAFTKLSNVEIFDATTGVVYDLSYYNDGGTATKVYRNTSIDIYMQSGVTHELVVRGDTASDATNQDYTAAISNAGSQLTIKETENDTAVTDITPNAVTLGKVTVQTAGVTFSLAPLSAAKNAVVGSEVEAIDLNIEAAKISNIKVTELKFKNDPADSDMTSSVVSGFKLYQSGVSTPIATVGTSTLASEEVTFPDLSIAVPAGTTAKFYVTATLVNDSSNNSKTLQLELSGYSAEENTDTSSDSVYDTTNDGTGGGGTANDGVLVAGTLRSARTITIVGQGILYVSTDNTDSKTDADIYAVAGTTSPELATLKLKAVNEDVKVKTIVVHSSYASIANVVSKLSLVKASDNTVVAEKTNIGQDTTFDNLSLIVPQSDTKFYLKADLNKIGQDQVGVLDQTALTWHFASIEAEGNASGSTLARNAVAGVVAGEIAYDQNGDGTFSGAETAATAESKSVGVLASRISSVELVPSYNGTTVATQIAGTGEYNVAIIKVTTDASTNTTSDGSDIKTVLQQVKLEVNKNSTTMALSGMTLQKIGGNGSAVNGTDDAGNGAFAAGGTGLGYAAFDLTGAGFGTDDEIAPSSTSYYVVKATVSALQANNGNDWIKIDLDQLNGADGDKDAAGANFSWIDATGAATKFPLRLDGISSIDGTKINEQS